MTAAPVPDLPPYEERCQAYMCPRAAVAIVSTACEHEHVYRGRACQRHKDLLAGGDGRCPECWRGEDQHDCDSLLTAVEDLP